MKKRVDSEIVYEVEEKEVVSTYTQRGRGEDEDSFVKA
jgi:hypothetical protein